MLNPAKGNMYGFVTHTWNTCYMKRFNNQKPVRFDETELKTNLGIGNFIFVGSSCDMWAKDIPIEWIQKTLDYCKYFDNKYLFQSKNPAMFYNCSFPQNTILATTIETNRMMSAAFSKALTVDFRALLMSGLKYHKRMVTIEPIMDFDLLDFVNLIRSIQPFQVNIGADSRGRNLRGCNLPEPSKHKIEELIKQLEGFTTVHLKSTLNRLLT